MCACVDCTRCFLYELLPKFSLALPSQCNSIEEKILEAARFKLNVDEKVIQAGMFSGTQVDAGVRKQYLVALLEGDSGTAAQVEAPPTYDELNEMLARSEEELAHFAQMDREMQQRDLETWMASSGRTSRLITEDELPEWLKVGKKAEGGKKQEAWQSVDFWPLVGSALGRRGVETNWQVGRPQ